jgi:hypothetical protein
MKTPTITRMGRRLGAGANRDPKITLMRRSDTVQSRRFTLSGKPRRPPKRVPTLPHVSILDGDDEDA